MIDKKALSWTILLISSYFLLSFSATSNILVSLSCSLLISPFVYAVLRDLMRMVTELMNRLTDYESFDLFALKLLASLGHSRNLLSIMGDVYKSFNKKSRSSSRIKAFIKKVLYQRILKCKKLCDKDVKFPSPTVEFLLSLMERLDFIDETSLKAFLTSLHNLSSFLRLNARKLRDFIAAEKVKYRVLQMASSMTLGFMIKMLSIFMNSSLFNVPLNLIVLTSFVVLSMIFFVVFPAIIHLRYPSFKEMALYIFIFLIFVILPPYEGV